MAQRVSIEWLGHQLHDLRAEYLGDARRNPAETMDLLVVDLAARLPEGFGDDLERAYAIGGEEKW